MCVEGSRKEDPWYYSSICGLEYMIPVRWRSRNEALNWKFSEHCFFFCLRATLKLKSLLPAGDETPLNSNPEAILRRPLPSRPPQCIGNFPPKHIPTNSIIYHLKLFKNPSLYIFHNKVHVDELHSNLIGGKKWVKSSMIFFLIFMHLFFHYLVIFISNKR